MSRALAVEVPSWLDVSAPRKRDGGIAWRHHIVMWQHHNIETSQRPKIAMSIFGEA
jgi:hypothetical protein